MIKYHKKKIYKLLKWEIIFKNCKRMSKTKQTTCRKKACYTKFWKCKSKIR